MNTNPDAELRALWTSQGVPVARQDQIIAEIAAKAQPAYLDGLFATELTPAGEQLVIPGCERNLAPAKTQLDLFG